MKSVDYEQLYYDSQYENKKLKDKVKFLEDTITEMNLSRNRNNINLQGYIINEMKRYKEKGDKKMYNKYPKILVEKCTKCVGCSLLEDCNFKGNQQCNNYISYKEMYEKIRN